MNESGSLHPLGERDYILCSNHIRSECRLECWVKCDIPGRVDDDIDIFCQLLCELRRVPEIRLANITADDCDFVADQAFECAPITRPEWIEDWR